MAYDGKSEHTVAAGLAAQFCVGRNESIVWETLRLIKDPLSLALVAAYIVEYLPSDHSRGLFKRALQEQIETSQKAATARKERKPEPESPTDPSGWKVWRAEDGGRFSIFAHCKHGEKEALETAALMNRESPGVYVPAVSNPARKRYFWLRDKERSRIANVGPVYFDDWDKVNEAAERANLAEGHERFEVCQTLLLPSEVAEGRASVKAGGEIKTFD